MPEAEGKEKIVLITGAGSGLGLGLTEHYLRQGATVYAADIDLQQLNSLKHERCHPLMLNVADAEGVVETVDAIVAEQGRLDLVINSAGIASAGEFQNITIQNWDRTIDINLKGTVYVCSAAYKQMVKQQSGHIVNISSMYGLIASPNLSAYVSSKHGILGLTYSLYHEAKPHNVKITAVCPGFIDTPFVEKGAYDGISSDEVAEQIPFTMISAEKAVRKIVAGIKKEKKKIIFPFYVHVLLAVDRFAPVLLNWTYQAFLRPRP